MSHLVSYKWIRKTQVIPELGVDYNVCGVLLGGVFVLGGYCIIHSPVQNKHKRMLKELS